MKHKIRYPDRISAQNYVLKGTMGSLDTATGSEILGEKLITSSANDDSVLREREPADPQLESFVDPFPELSRPRQESTDSNTENQANAKKRRVPTILLSSLTRRDTSHSGRPCLTWRRSTPHSSRQPRRLSPTGF